MKKRSRQEEGEDGDEQSPFRVDPMVVEAAKSNRSTCKRCEEKIDKGVLRIQVTDRREYDLWEGAFGRNDSGPFFEDEGFFGNTVTKSSHWWHLDCYNPGIGPVEHEHARGFYQRKGLKKPDQAAFEHWFRTCASLENAWRTLWLIRLFRHSVLSMLDHNVMDLICLHVSRCFYLTPEWLPTIEARERDNQDMKTHLDKQRKKWA